MIVTGPGPIILVRHDIRSSAPNFSRSLSFTSIGLGLERFSIPEITLTEHLAQTATAPQELPIGKSASWITSIRLAPGVTSR